jgi:hypothetical protein
MLLYLILNKVQFRCFGVLTSIKSGLRFDVNLETDKNTSWRPQDTEKFPTETFLDDFGPQVEIKRGPRAAQNLSKTTKTERYHRRNRVFSSSCSSCGCKRPTWSIWGRFGVDLGSIWGSIWGAILCYLGSILNRSVCLSVCLSLSAIQTSRGNCQTTHLLSLDSHPKEVHFERSLSAIQTSRGNCQTTHLLSLDSHPKEVHFERCLRLDTGNHFAPLVVLRFPPNRCIV